MDILDKELAQSNSKTLRYKRGKNGSFSTRVLGWIIGIFFFIAFVQGVLQLRPLLILIGLVFSLIGFFMATSTYGVKVNVGKGLIMNYVSFLRIDFGSWKDSGEWKFLSVLTQFRKENQQVVLGAGPMMVPITDSSSMPTEKRYEVVFLNHEHRQKNYLRYFETEEDAYEFAHALAQRMSMEVVKFNPPIAQSRIARR